MSHQSQKFYLAVAFIYLLSAITQDHYVANICLAVMYFLMAGFV